MLNVLRFKSQVRRLSTKVSSPPPRSTFSDLRYCEEITPPLADPLVVLAVTPLIVIWTLPTYKADSARVTLSLSASPVMLRTPVFVSNAAVALGRSRRSSCSTPSRVRALRGRGLVGVGRRNSL